MHLLVGAEKLAGGLIALLSREEWCIRFVPRFVVHVYVITSAVSKSKCSSAKDKSARTARFMA